MLKVNEWFRSRLTLLLFLFMFFSSCSLLAPLVLAQANSSNPATQSGSSATSQPFDVKAAVDAYLAKVPRDQRVRSDAYFEGGYWLLLWDFLSVVLVMWILLRFRWSALMRDLAERITRLVGADNARRAYRLDR